MKYHQRKTTSKKQNLTLKRKLKENGIHRKATSLEAEDDLGEDNCTGNIVLEDSLTDSKLLLNKTL